MPRPESHRIVYADEDLARRLEGLAAREMWRMARAARALFPERDPLAIDVAGGVAAYVGEGSPINEAFGLGFAGEVTDEDVSLLERFYSWRQARGKVAVCPFADPSLWRLLGEQGWVPDTFENVLIMPLGPHTELAEPAVEIRACGAGEHDLWARVVAVGFAAPCVPTQAELDLAHLISARDEAVLLLAWIDGEPAGTGELVIDGGVGWLSADTTLPPYRQRGVQRSMQLERVRRARDAGCDLAATEASPGSPSQRNMERLGFRIAYTRVDLVAPWHAEVPGSVSVDTEGT